MSNTITTRLSIVPLAIAHFRWVWDSNPWDPLMLHSLLPLHRHNIPLISLRLTKMPNSLSGFNTSANRSKRFYRNPMLSTSSAMINTGYHTSFRLVTKSGYINRRSVSPGPIESFTHFVMGLTVNSNLVQYLLQTDIQKRTEKMQWQIQTLHRDFSPGNPNRENQHILY
jgi:hypothetical protein